MNKYLILTTALLFRCIFTFGQDFHWAKSFGSSNTEAGSAIATDNFGNVITAGSFIGTVDFNPGGNSTLLTSTNGVEDIFICKHDSLGNLVWAKKMGGTGEENCNSIFIDANGNILATGRYKLTADFDPGLGTFNLTSNGGYDVFILKLDMNGNFIWAKSLGSSNNSNIADIAKDIIADTNGNIYVTGSFSNIVDFDPGIGVFNLTASNTDAFILKLNPNGDFLWAKQKDVLQSTDDAWSLTLDGNSDLIIGHQSTAQTGISSYIIEKRNSSNGNIIFALDGQGTGAVSPRSVLVDNLDNILVIGAFSGTTDFNPSAAATYNLTSAGQNDVYIQKLTTTGAFIWAKSIGGILADDIQSATLDEQGNILIGGSFRGTSDFDPSTSTYNITAISSPISDAYLLKLNSLGNFVSVFNYGSVGSIGNNTINGISFDGNKSIYFTGRYNNTIDFDQSSNTYNLSSNGGFDCFVVKLNPCPTPAGAVSGSQNVCQNQNAVTYSLPLIPNASTYNWTLPIGATGTSSTNSITVNFGPTATSGNITVKGVNACGEGALTSLPITVNPLPDVAGIIVGATTVCQGQSAINYSVPAIANAVSYIWTLPNGATGSSTTNTIIVNYGIGAVSGNITVKGTNACGDGQIATLAVAVNPIPSAAGIITGNSAVCQGQNAINYTVPPILNATSYIWTLPTGATGTSATNSIIVDYGATAVSGNISVKGLNSCGEGQASSLAITVTPLVAAAGNIIGATTVCQGQTQVTYVVPPINNASTYIWTLPGGATGFSTTNSITIDFGLTASSGSISVSGLNNCGQGMASSLGVTVNQSPSAVVSSNSATSFCQGGNVILNANVGIGLTFQWQNNGNNIAGATSASYTATAAGSYTVVVTNTNNCSATSTASAVTVNALPATPTISANGATSICQGGSVQLTSSSATGNLWSNGATSQSINVNNSGNYTVAVTNANNCSATSAATAVTVNALPATPSISSNGSTTFCQGGSVQLTSSSATGNLWSNGATSQSINVNNSGNYTVTVTNVNNCSATSTATAVTVNALPSTPSISSNGSTTFCQGGSVQLTSSAATGNVWSNGATSQSITVNNSGNYTVTVTNADNCSATSTATIIQVNNAPIFTAQPLSQTVPMNATVSFISQAGSVSYQWQTNQGGGFQNISNGGQYIGATDDTLQVTNVTMLNDNQEFRCVINDGLCSDSSAVGILTVTNTVGLSNDFSNSSFNIYPNPTNDILIIELTQSETVIGFSMQVINVLGQSVFNITSKQKRVILNTNDWGAKGTYFIQLKTFSEEIIGTQKIIVY